MNLIPVKTPKWIKGIFPNYIWNMPTDQKIIYLTFDDGPTPEITNWTLDLLKSYHAKATFFCIGNNIEKHPQIFKDILNDGHAIGNHTFNHPNGWTTNTDAYLKEVLKTEYLINVESRVHSESGIINPSHITQNSKLFRPPYGKIKSSQGKHLLDLGYKIIMWDILAFDWMDSITPDQCAKDVISKAGNGSIIVFHDSIKASKNMMHALPEVLDYFNEHDFSFKHL